MKHIMYLLSAFPTMVQPPGKEGFFSVLFIATPRTESVHRGG